VESWWIFFAENYKINIAAPRGGKYWNIETLNKLLHNEKHTRNVMLQKTYIPDVLTGQQKCNDDQMTKYYVVNTHEAIIAKELFDKRK